MKMHSDLGKMYRRNYMVKSQLNSLEAKSRALNEKIGDQTKIDEWAESYITRADAQIDDVHDYMNFRNIASLGHVRMRPQVTMALPAPKLPVYGQERVPADAVPTLQPESLPPGTTELLNTLWKQYRSGMLADSNNDSEVVSLLGQIEAYIRKEKLTRDTIDNDQHKSVIGPLIQRIAQRISELEGVDNLGWTEALPQVGLWNTFGSVLTLGLMGATYGVISYDEYQNKGNMWAMWKPRLENAAFYAGIGALIAVGYQGVVGTGQWTGGY